MTNHKVQEIHTVVDQKKTSCKVLSLKEVMNSNKNLKDKMDQLAEKFTKTKLYEVLDNVSRLESLHEIDQNLRKSVQPYKELGTALEINLNECLYSDEVSEKPIVERRADSVERILLKGMFLYEGIKKIEQRAETLSPGTDKDFIQRLKEKIIKMAIDDIGEIVHNIRTDLKSLENILNTKEFNGKLDKYCKQSSELVKDIPKIRKLLSAGSNQGNSESSLKGENAPCTSQGKFDEILSLLDTFNEQAVQLRGQLYTQKAKADAYLADDDYGELSVPD